MSKLTSRQFGKYLLHPTLEENSWYFPLTWGRRLEIAKTQSKSSVDEFDIYLDENDGDYTYLGKLFEQDVEQLINTFQKLIL